MYDFDFSPEKNEQLKQERGVCFEDIIPLLKDQEWLDILQNNKSEKYKHQKIYVIEYNNEIYAVPFVIDDERKVFFLKTIYPSRMLRKIYKP